MTSPSNSRPVLKKAVFPVAGLGTRFLPATKANPKEMLPVVDKPLIQYAVEEAVAAGFSEMIFVTGRNKRAIEDHFDKAYELEMELQSNNKTKLLQILRDSTPAHVSYAYVRQGQSLGLGHAVLSAAPLVNDEPFAVILADDLIVPGALTDMVKAYHEGWDSVLSVMPVLQHEVIQYGIVQTDSDGRVRDMVEKPAPEKAPSNLAVVGRYILPASIFELLRHTPPGYGQEIQLTDAICRLAKDCRVLAQKCVGERFDCGSKLGYLKANIALGLQHEELYDSLRAYLQTLTDKH